MHFISKKKQKTSFNSFDLYSQKNKATETVEALSITECRAHHVSVGSTKMWNIKIP